MTSDREYIEFRNVSARFPGAPNDGWVARRVSLTLGEGELVSVIGPSGCGKSTLLKMAAGMQTPASGQVLLNGAPITEPGPERGVVFQEYGVFPWLNVRRNIEFGLTLGANRLPDAERRRLGDRYLDLMGLRDFQHAYPNTLSGGMRQRLALARAYAVKPRFLLMDEPFGALDAQTRLTMHDLLLDLQRQESKGVLLITHSVEEALYLSSRIVLLSARPATVAEVIEVPFPYPRDSTVLATPEFSRLQAELRDKVLEQYFRQQQADHFQSTDQETHHAS